MAQTTHLWAEIQAWFDVLYEPPSQRKLASNIGVKPNAISEWKLGQSKPTPEHLDRLADEMRPVMGPDIDARLQAAVMRDQGYNPDAIYEAARRNPKRPPRGPRPQRAD